MNLRVLTRDTVSMFPADIIRKYGDMYCDWSDDVEEKFSLFKPNTRLKRFVSRIIKKQTALVLGAGLSSTTGPFKERWKEYEDIYDTLTDDPGQVEGFVELYSRGGVKVKPKLGNGVIPNLIQSGFTSSILTFNYNCHVQYCLGICKIGFESIVYNGEKRVEQTIVGKPKCRIFKPHGSARLSRSPPIISRRIPSWRGQPLHPGMEAPPRDRRHAPRESSASAEEASPQGPRAVLRTAAARRPAARSSRQIR